MSSIPYISQEQQIKDYYNKQIKELYYKKNWVKNQIERDIGLLKKIVKKIVEMENNRNQELYLCGFSEEVINLAEKKYGEYHSIPLEEVDISDIITSSAGIVGWGGVQGELDHYRKWCRKNKHMLTSSQTDNVVT